jgi:YidC/Oxa1 family membrane protein insertase
MEKIRDRYKDDRVKQQQEMMALYKNQKINPMSGCLPIVLQIPVFFALYKVLFVTIDMRHAPFFGWIKDLSAPDPTSLFNLFGLLPFTVPELLHVGAWPIIMGITMWVQMQLNPQQPDPMQQRIFNWMPVMFTFLLASFPAGLVIYWAWNNVLSLIQQYYIMQKNGAEIHLWKNLGFDKGTKGGGAGGSSGGGWDAAKLKERLAASAKGLNVGKLKDRVTSLATGLPDKFGKPRKPAAGPPAEAHAAPNSDGAGAMSREQALRTLGLEPDATDFEIDAALEREGKARKGLNGTDHAFAAKLSAAREALRGKAGS